MRPDAITDEWDWASAELVAVPQGTLPTVAVLSADSVFRDGATGAAATDASAPLVELGEAVQFRDLRLVPVRVRHARPVSGGLMVYPRVEFDIAVPPGAVLPSRTAAGFSDLYRLAALNRVDATSGEPEGLLIIVPDDFYNNALALARWKERKGYHVSIRRLSETGSTANAVRDYIANAYRTWPVRPAYVLLIGTKSIMPYFVIQTAGVVTDHTFGCIEGNDFFPEVLVGRLPANSGPMLDYLTQKIINYECSPPMAEPIWFRRAAMVATIYQEGGTPTVTALQTKRWVRNLMLDRGYLEVDTIYDPPWHGNAVAPIDSAIDKGTLFVNGRGWGNSGGWNYPTYRINDLATLNNGWKLPVITSLYCGTGAFNADPCFGEAWLQVGSPTQPKGAVAFFGPSWLSTSTRWNNCLDYGIYRGILDEGLATLGPAMLRAKLEVFRNFPMPCDTYYLRVYFYTYNIIGDPTLQLWTGGVPGSMSVEYANRVAAGTSSFGVTVRESGGSPVRGAQVSLLKGSQVKATALSDATGRAEFRFSPLSGGESLLVTLTRPGFLPHLGSAWVEDRGTFVGYQNHSSSAVGPGATVSVNIDLKNYGTGQTASGVSARLRTSDLLATVLDSVKDYGDIAPGAVVTGGPFTLQVSAACSSGYRLSFTILARSGDSSWSSGFTLVVTGPRFNFRRHEIAGGVLRPGEAADIVVTLRNDGNEPLNNVRGSLTSASNAAVVEDAAGSFGNIPAGDSAANAADVFRVRAKPDVASGRRLGFELLVQGDGGFTQLLRFTILIGEVEPNVALGPDAYGYYAYDDIDSGCAERPDYQWVEIDPGLGGAGFRLNLGNDDIRTIGLPFWFRHYGRSYSRISVSDNGFLACDSTDLHSIYNWTIPSAYGPPGVIAPFWDDFRCDTLEASGVYWFHDEPNHRFIVEWSRVHHVHGFKPPIVAELQSFQAILYDPAHHPTRTGDGEIVFQYQTVYDDDTLPNNSHSAASVGIADHTCEVGLQCSFGRLLSPGVAALVSGRAIKFTTDPPDTFVAVAEPGRKTAMPAGLWFAANPVSGPVTVHWSLPAGAPGEIAVFDRAGRSMTSARRVSAPAGLFRLELPSGVYFVALTHSEGGRIINFARKLVVSR